MSITKRSGKLKCGACGKEVVIGLYMKSMAFCPDDKCINSEEQYYK